MAGLFDSWNRGVQVGRENRRQRVLGQNLQGALGGDQAALSNVFGVDHDAGMRVQQFAAQQQKAQQDSRQAELDEFGKVAGAFASTKNPQLYSRFVMLGSKLGFVPPGAPQQPSPEDLEESAQAAMALAQAYGSKAAPEPFTLGPGSKRFDASGRVIAEVPFAPPKQDFVLSPDGTQWLPKPTGMPQQPMGQPQSGDPFASLRSSIPDLRVTSQFRTPEENAKLPNSVPNSFHLTGQAIDIGRPSPQQRQQINAWASQNGYEVIDNYRDGHVHLEPRGRPQGAIPIPGAIPRQGAEETFSQPQVVTDPATGKQMLVQFGNRGGRRTVSDYAPPPTSRDAKPPTEGERNAAGYYSRMEAAERELGAISASGHDPTNLRDFYSAGQGPFRNWMASDKGQMFRQQQEDWVRAKLRKESGAVIGDEEMEREIRVYFPQPGDSPAVIKQKAQSRRIAIEAMRKSGGRAVDDAAPAQSGGTQNGGWSIKVKP